MQHFNLHSSWKWPARQRSVRRFSFRRKLALWFGLVMLLSTCLAIGLSYRVAEQVAVEQFSEKLMTMASSGAMGIDGDAFHTLQHPQQMKSETYQQIQTHLRRLREANRFFRVRYVYTMAPVPQSDKWRYVVDSEEKGSEDFSPL
ncbi:MAG TPA: hypothetical protein VNA16_10565, partial [Abditibacteriaceae bacterium]|nr:hypothetical protein [Abditibacteriaceae bacterium]